MDDLAISDGIVIPDEELAWTFSPSGGPGGQHANRSSTRAEVRFDVASSRAFDATTRSRIIGRLGGEIVTVVVDETRSQWRNRQLARRRLAERLRAAMEPPPPRRKPTKPTRASQRRRVDGKRARSQTKQLRKPPRSET